MSDDDANDVIDEFPEITEEQKQHWLTEAIASWRSGLAEGIYCMRLAEAYIAHLDREAEGNELLSLTWVKEQMGVEVWSNRTIHWLIPGTDNYLFILFTGEHKCKVSLDGTVLMTPKTKADFRMIQKVCRMEAK